MYSSLVAPPDSSMHSKNINFLTFIKVNDKIEKLTPENFTSEIADKFVNLGDNMNSLLEHMTSIVIPNFLHDSQWP